MKENFELHEEPKNFKKEIEGAKIGFEKLAKRLDMLWQKDKLTFERCQGLISLDTHSMSFN